MSTLINHQVRLKSRPPGIPQAEHFELASEPVPALQAGQILVRNLYLSVEPAMRGWVGAVANYSEPVALGAVMRSFAAGRVEASRDPAVPVGTQVTGLFGWQDYAVVEAAAIERRVEEDDLPLSTALGVMGINGVTAHYGLLELGQPRPGETVVVSTAAGSVGSCVGQIAKIRGCRAVGIAGGELKRAQCLERFGFDAAVDYKAADFDARLAEACAGGVDVYFDNTGGAISDAVMARLKVGARVVYGTFAGETIKTREGGKEIERKLLHDDDVIAFINEK